MCIFANTVEKVSNTRIAVAPLPGGNSQLTIYENRAMSQGQNAMILPVPWGPNGVKLISMEQYRNIWSDLELYFPKSPSFSASASFGWGGSASKAPLQVWQVGGYKCSIASCIDDIDRLNPGVFTLPPDIKQLLVEHYTEGFGFVVCMFDGSVAEHPIAYISHMHKSGHLFIPTMHEHGEHTIIQPTLALRGNEQHENVWCDGCGAREFTGTRWHCANCPNNPGFDLCDTCHANPRHDGDHLFLEIVRPLPSGNGLIDMPQLLPRTLYNNKRPKASSSSVAQFDHIIYIINAVSLNVVDVEHSRTAKHAQHIAWNRMGLAGFQVRSVQKVTIDGDYENIDLWAAPVK